MKKNMYLISNINKMMFVCYLLLISTYSLVAQDKVKIELNPEEVYLIKTDYTHEIHCDFYLTNTAEDSLHLHKIDLQVYDQNDDLILCKYIAYQGVSPSILTIPKRELIKDKTICIYNPFYSFPADLEIASLKFVFTFRTNKFELSKYTVLVKPRHFESKTKLQLPVKDFSLIYDGNDFYSHHRRFDFTHFAADLLGIKKQSNRYGYDFCPADEKGMIYSDEGKKLENWVGFGKNIYTTASGVVVESFNDAPDAEVGKILFDYREATEKPRIMNGNYVVIDHGNGEYSHFMHMKNGSLKVKTGDKVEAGQLLGQIGNSGDSYTPHLHYQLCNGVDMMNSDGIPAYFRNFYRMQGTKKIISEKSYLLTGEFVNSN